MCRATLITEIFHRPWAQAKSNLRVSMLMIVFMGITAPGCALIEGIANIVSGTVKGTVWVLRGVYEPLARRKSFTILGSLLSKW
ncbi:hypothetical protein [Candidatus Nitrospira salsa]